MLYLAYYQRWLSILLLKEIIFCIKTYRSENPTVLSRQLCRKRLFDKLSHLHVLKFIKLEIFQA